MCGFNGIFAYGRDAPPVDREELLRTRDRMSARGPDGVGAWIHDDGRIGIGHRRLSIIDLRAIADQPMIHDGGRLRIVFNGEIYNYRQLRDELQSTGANFVTESDTEVILHLWDRVGPALVDRLRGMYALALWDDTKRALFLARDPQGIKPLYLADDSTTLRFASQVKALVAGGKIDTRPEPAGHTGFFLWGCVPEPWTLHRGVRALPAGTTLLVDASGKRETRRHFDLTAVLRDAKAGKREVLAEILTDSVRHHLVADVPVGVFLSAGLDSTTIAALAAEIGGSALKTLTLGFEEFRGTLEDETALAEQVARDIGAAHETRWVRGADFAQSRALLLHAMDQPSIDGVNTYFVARAARAAGLKVALSGLGGDELFASYPSFRQVPELPRRLARVASLRALGPTLRRIAEPAVARFTSPKYAGLLEYGTTIAGAYLLRRSLFMPWELPRLLPPELVTEGLGELATLKQLDATIDGLDDSRLQVTALESSWYMTNQLLRDADWAGMAHSIEIRTPLVDAILVRRIAPLLASGERPDKRAMADAPSRKLPQEVLARRKTGFVVPVRDWIASGNAAAERGLRGWAKQVHASFGGVG
jgi:asparagine synthase (glutamine-hydrolysing)